MQCSEIISLGYLLFIVWLFGYACERLRESKLALDRGANNQRSVPESFRPCALLLSPMELA